MQLLEDFYGDQAKRIGLQSLDFLATAKPGSLFWEYVFADSYSANIASQYRELIPEVIGVSRSLKEGESTFFPGKKYPKEVLSVLASTLYYPFSIARTETPDYMGALAEDLAALSVFMGMRTALVSGKAPGDEDYSSAELASGGIGEDALNSTVAGEDIASVLASAIDEHQTGDVDWESHRKLRLLNDNGHGVLLRADLSLALRLVFDLRVPKFELVILVDEETSMLEFLLAAAISERVALFSCSSVLTNSKAPTKEETRLPNYLAPGNFETEVCAFEKRVAEIAAVPSNVFSFQIADPVVEPVECDTAKAIKPEALKFKNWSTEDPLNGTVEEDSLKSIDEAESFSKNAEHNKFSCEQIDAHSHTDLAPRPQETSSDTDLRNFLVVKQNVKHFVHFTTVRNLPTILQHGILPRSDALGIATDFLDPLRLDGSHTRTCLSISYPNWFYLNSVFYREDKSVNREDIVFLLIEAEKLLCEGAGARLTFYPTNAASKQMISDTSGPRRGVSGASALFEPELRLGDWVTSREKEGIPPWCPTNPQAEVQYEGVIPVSWIQYAVAHQRQTYDSVHEVVADSNVIAYRSFKPFYEDSNISDLPRWWKSYQRERQRIKGALGGN